MLIFPLIIVLATLNARAVSGIPIETSTSTSTATDPNNPNSTNTNTNANTNANTLNNSSAINTPSNSNTSSNPNALNGAPSPTSSTTTSPYSTTGGNPYSTTGASPYSTNGASPYSTNGASPYSTNGASPYSTTGANPTGPTSNTSNPGSATTDQNPNSTALATQEDGQPPHEDNTDVDIPKGYRQELDPNIKHLKDNMRNLVDKKEYETAAHTMRTAIDTSIHGIKWNVLNALKDHADQNRELVDKRKPGHPCIEKMHEDAVTFINFVVNESFLNTHEYKNINWRDRANVLAISTKNVKDEICTLESQMNDFVRDCIKDINRMGHIGFGLQNAPSTHPRYKNYEKECETTTCSYKLPDWATAPAPVPPPPPPPAPAPKFSLAVRPQPVVIQQPQIIRRPVYTLTTTTTYNQPARLPPGRGLAYNVGRFAANVVNTARQGNWG